MSSDLLSIARSGAMAARIALDVTAQNIANASSAGYVRRSVSLAEVTSSGGFGRSNDVSLSGVRLDRVIRNVDQFRQNEVRRTDSDAARAGTELNALENIETAVEQSGLYPAIIGFDTALQRLSTDPVDPSLRSAALEAARTLAGTFNLAASGLEASSTLQRFEAQDEINQVNDIASELGLVNLRLSRAGIDSSDQAALLDQRDLLLDRLAGFSDITTEIAPDQSVTVRLGGSTGPQLVSGGTTQPLAMTTAGDGTISFTLGAGSVAPSGGSLAGRASALTTAAATRTTLDGLANSLISAANAAQASGAALDGVARPAAVWRQRRKRNQRGTELPVPGLRLRQRVQRRAAVTSPTSALCAVRCRVLTWLAAQTRCCFPFPAPSPAAAPPAKPWT